MSGPSCNQQDHGRYRRYVLWVVLFPFCLSPLNGEVLADHPAPKSQIHDNLPIKSCVDAEYNVLHGPTPPGSSKLKGDGSDELEMMQSILDAASSGDNICLPAAPAFYGIAGQLDIKNPVTLLGDGWLAGSARSIGDFSGSELRQLSPSAGPMIKVTTGDVYIDGLKLSGYHQPKLQSRRDTSGIAVEGEAGNDLHNVTIRNCWLEHFLGQAIDLRHTHHFIVDNCRIQEVGYAGILVAAGNVGEISNNTVDGVLGSIVDQNSGAINAYPIVGTNYGEVNTDNLLVKGNFVKDSPHWVGIMNHAGTAWLVYDNIVQNADFAYASTSTSPTPEARSGETAFINNKAFGCAREENNWILTTHDGWYIGNVFVNCSHMFVADADRPRVTWNAYLEPDTTLAIRLATAGPVTDMVLAHNDWGGLEEVRIEGHVTYDDSWDVPPPPSQFLAVQDNNYVNLHWKFNDSIAHDSFYIEYSEDGNSDWRRVAYRPPNNGRWNFTSTNPYWIQFDPLTYKDENVSGGYYRIRANNGSEYSKWSIASVR